MRSTGMLVNAWLIQELSSLPVPLCHFQHPTLLVIQSNPPFPATSCPSSLGLQHVPPSSHSTSLQFSPFSPCASTPQNPPSIPPQSLTFPSPSVFKFPLPLKKQKQTKPLPPHNTHNLPLWNSHCSPSLLSLPSFPQVSTPSSLFSSPSPS
jgi:hypothetical protein